MGAAAPPAGAAVPSPSAAAAGPPGTRAAARPSPPAAVAAEAAAEAAAAPQASAAARGAPLAEGPVGPVGLWAANPRVRSEGARGVAGEGSPGVLVPPGLPGVRETMALLPLLLLRLLAGPVAGRVGRAGQLQKKKRWTKKHNGKYRDICSLDRGSLLNKD